ncbi:major facilitator superfamily protein [Sarocladium implicatum]|nr:major facilitator superfamily protein [Sarocladium implicatum]
MAQSDGSEGVAVPYGNNEKDPNPVQMTADQLVGDEIREIDPEVEKRVLRKIDWFLMPAMVFGYGLVYYDKAILGSAALFGMTADLQLSVIDSSTTPPTVDTSRLSWATSIFYFGQLVGSYPMTYLLQKVGARKSLGPAVIFWGIVCASTAGVTSWRGLLAQRFFLGFTESIVPTAFVITVSGFYTQQEQSLRQTWWFSGTGWFTIIGGAFNYGFAKIDNSALHPWQYLYIFAGCLTVLFGLWCFALPASGADAWFLNEEERVVAVERLRAGQTGIANHKIKPDQIKESLVDVKVWLVALMMASAYTVNGAISGFGPLIVATFGFTATEAILLQFPLGAICAIGIPLTGYITSKFRNLRILILILCCLPVIAGYVIIWQTEWGVRPAAPVVGYTIVGFFGPVVGLIVSIGGANAAGSTKKSFMASTIFVAYCVGNIVGPQMIRSETKHQHYPALWSSLIGCYAITMISAAVLWVLFRRENNRRDRLNLPAEEANKTAFEDLTDKQNLHFRYAL